MEAINEDFPSLKPWQIYGAIASYLEHHAEIDRFLEAESREIERVGVPMAVANTDLYAEAAL